MKIPDHIEIAIQAYYAERATPEDIAALEAWFREDESHVRIFAEHGMLEWQILCEQEKADATAVLTILREAEDKAEPDFSLLHAPALDSASTKVDKRSIAFLELCSLAGYFTAKGLRAKAGLIGSIAAVLVIGAVLYVSLFGLGGTPESPDIANTPSNPDRAAPGTPANNIIVATLTAEHNAVWGRRPGEDLYAGQRFTLAQGFAEITTNSGAMVILEAPATIELLDNNNALRLHAGKLVGICETDLSKGFLVRTSQMDVTDLGTRFGVEVIQDQVTATVFSGEIEVATPGSGPHLLKANQTARLDFGVDSNPPMISDRLAQGFGHLRSHAARVGDAVHRLRPIFDMDAADWAGSPPTDLRFQKQVSEKPKIILERAGVMLERDVQVEVSPDTPTLQDEPPMSRVAAGQRVDVYLVHLDSPGGRAIFNGTLDFGRPILGVITSGPRLSETDASLGLPGARYPGSVEPKDRTRGCNRSPGNFIDQLRIDQNTCHLDLTVAGYFDQVRILVRSEETQ